MTVERNQILNWVQVQQKIKRIAFQVYERNFMEDTIIFAGVQGSGYAFAQMLRADFTEISDLKSDIIQVALNKKTPMQSEVKLDKDIALVENKTVILIDDVLHTGRTFAYGLKPFLNVRLKKLQTAVLVDRSHKRFPVSADYVGYTLSTTLQEHIDVELNGLGEFNVYLS